MGKHYRAIARAEGSSESGRSVFVASTAEIARDGDIIEGPWRVANYERNPVILWAHRHDGMPIGRGVVTEEGGQLRVEVEWDEADPVAAEVARKVRSGFLSAVSVGWIPGELVPLRSLPPEDTRRREMGYLHRSPELLEVSVVPVPSDPRATAIQRADSEDPPEDAPAADAPAEEPEEDDPSVIRVARLVRRILRRELPAMVTAEMQRQRAESSKEEPPAETPPEEELDPDAASRAWLSELGRHLMTR